MAHEGNVDALLREVGIASQRLRSAREAICQDLGVTPAMQGVIDALFERGGQTVPSLARAQGVSRQHVQALVDALWERRLCAFRANPAHARSQIVELTAKGRATFETLRGCDRSLVADLSAGLTADVATALAVLRRLNAALARRTP